MPKFRIIICKESKYKDARLPSYISTHFAGKPHNLEVGEPRKILEEVAEVNVMITNKKAFRQSDLLFIAATSKPIIGITMPKRTTYRNCLCLAFNLQFYVAMKMLVLL